jgi:hypothetical protein
VLAGRTDTGQLVAVGQVGTGFSTSERRRLYELLRDLFFAGLLTVGADRPWESGISCAGIVHGPNTYASPDITHPAGGFDMPHGRGCATPRFTPSV